MKKTIAVYKAVFGNYDEIKSELFAITPSNESSLYDFSYYYITDANVKVPEPWKLVQIQKKYSDNALENRFYKMHVPSILQDYDYTIYLDGNISINGDLSTLLTDKLKKEDYLFAYPHYKNPTLGEEIISCFLFSKISLLEFVRIRKSLDTHLDEKVGFECGVLLRKSNNPLLLLLADKWFEAYINNVRRDQFYFSPALKQLNIQCKVLGVNDIRDNAKFFRLHPHKEKIAFFKKLFVVIKVRLYNLIFGKKYV